MVEIIIAFYLSYLIVRSLEVRTGKKPLKKSVTHLKGRGDSQKDDTECVIGERGSMQKSDVTPSKKYCFKNRTLLD